MFDLMLIIEGYFDDVLFDFSDFADVVHFVFTVDHDLTKFINKNTYCLVVVLVRLWSFYQLLMIFQVHGSKWNLSKSELWLWFHDRSKPLNL